MVKIGLRLKANLENVTNLRPDGEDFRWYIKVKCGNCNEESEKWLYITQAESLEVKGGRGTANLIFKCKLCSREHHMDIITESIKPYNEEDQGKFKTVVIFDCRGMEPSAFSPRNGWSVNGLESGTSFTDVDLTEKEWADYDEKAKETVGIYELEHEFARFPNKSVIEAYLKPEVNKSRERFTWSEPDQESLRDYLQEKIGWNREKFNTVVAPVLQRFTNKEYQTRIDSFFTAKISVGSKTMTISKRVLNAINKAADFQSNHDAEQSMDAMYGHKKASAETKKRRQEVTKNASVVKRNKKREELKTSESQAASGPSKGNGNQGGEKISQRERDRQILAMNKLKAIETLKRSRGKGKRLPQRAPLPQARLSDSDSSSS